MDGAEQSDRIFPSFSSKRKKSVKALYNRTEM